MKKSYKIQTEIKLQTICVPNIRICKFDHIYLNIEVFGETQRTKFLHPEFPIKSEDKFYFEKVFWSPECKEEVYKLLRDSPVSIELRHLHGGFKHSQLLAFADLNAHEILLNKDCYNRDIFSNEKSFDLKSTENHYGPAPRVKLLAKTRILETKTPLMDELTSNEQMGHFCCIHDNFRLKRNQICQGGSNIADTSQMFSCNCELHRDSDADSNDNDKERKTKSRMTHCRTCHQDFPKSSLNDSRYSWKGPTFEQYPLTFDDETNNDKDNEQNEFDATNTKFRPPFVIRKVSPGLVGRTPDAYDSIYNTTIRENTRLRSRKQQPLHRLRSVSPAKHNGKLSRSMSSSSDMQETCYACRLPPDEVRISCDACNLTHRGEVSSRAWDLARPEPPVLRTFRETTDQRPVYGSNNRSHNCRLCNRDQINKSLGSMTSSYDADLMRNRQPLYQIDGYRNMAKYFS